MFLILLPLRFICRTDSVFAAVGALLRLGGAAEKKMAVVTSINHLYITCVIIAETWQIHKMGGIQI